jgi:hypothetical protein
MVIVNSVKNSKAAYSVAGVKLASWNLETLSTRNLIINENVTVVKDELQVGT